ncbi:hypothetical protein, unlikely [Trypanosoma brucei brucei TREU927]|uniref:Uncharacterized protein n=1 Tax=Trypanosoma brucei brucei (strain 927/4 GUTat10.1) TaxID=185431 RepID=Q38CM8_TRYB2|nr:hypothetical protein, unlikely [Trypanosoma brucei brucei TREU927]EAN77442.1 hypothetical protein, unlikely [Trypanosoma brucei brucei TREU927]
MCKSMTVEVFEFGTANTRFPFLSPSIAHSLSYSHLPMQLFEVILFFLTFRFVQPPPLL